MTTCLKGKMANNADHQTLSASRRPGADDQGELGVSVQNWGSVFIFIQNISRDEATPADETKSPNL